MRAAFAPQGRAAVTDNLTLRATSSYRCLAKFLAEQRSTKNLARQPSPGCLRRRAVTRNLARSWLNCAW